MLSKVLQPKQQCILGLLNKTNILDTYYLAGGTGAAFQLGHRKSDDFDFFTAETLAAFNILDRISSLKKEKEMLVVGQTKGSLHIVLDDVKVSFLHYNYPLLDPPTVIEGINVAALLDIALMKITAISDRGSKKDFIDLFYMCKEGKGFQSLMQYFHEKYKGVGYQTYHIVKSLAYFEDAEKEPDPIMLIPYSWEEVKNYFVDECRKML